ncbi:MAG TPA: hypothetical protein PK655_02820 [archaeon]|nr:hypothetical protein [archaeon]HPV66360.1 hypothetical protein [archaeon]
MAKKENRSLIIWALICLAVGLIMGLFLTTVVTTGKAMKALGERANLEEARTNLTLDTLNVNTIKNRENNQLLMQSTNGFMVDSQNSRIVMYPSQTIDNMSMQIATEDNLFVRSAGGVIGLRSDGEGVGISAQHGRIVNTAHEFVISDAGYIENPYFKVQGLQNSDGLPVGIGNVIVGPESSFLAYNVTLGKNQGDFGIKISTGSNDNSISQVQINVPTKYVNLTGTGNAYACLTSDGTLYRSQTPCELNK